MVDMSSILPPGAPFRPYRIDADLRSMLAHRGMAPDAVAELLHDMGCGQLDAFVRLGEALPSRMQPTLFRDETLGTILFDAALGNGVTWSAGSGCCFIHTHSIPDTLVPRLPGMRAGDAVTHPALDPARRILSVTSHDDGSHSLVLEDRTERVRPLPRRMWKAATARQAAAQTAAFGDRPAEWESEREEARSLIPERNVIIPVAIVFATITLLGEALAVLLTGTWSLSPIVGAAIGLVIVAYPPLATTLRTRRALRGGCMPDRIGRVHERLDAAMAAHAAKTGSV